MLQKISATAKLYFIIFYSFLLFVAICDFRIIFNTTESTSIPTQETMLTEMMIDEIESNDNSSDNAQQIYITAKNKHKPTKISQKGIELIKYYEQCRLNAYCIKGEKYNTIGWGHVIYPGDKTPNKISQTHADRLLEQDLQWVNNAACRLISKLNKDVVMSQGFFDGLCSMIYNCGERGVETSLFYKRMQRCRYKGNKINKSDLYYSIAAVKQSRISHPGHIPRRYDEHKLMLN